LTVFSPFLKLMVSSIILAVNLYPAHQSVARKLGKRQGLASVILVVFGIALIVAPTWLLMNSFADSVQRFVGAVQENHIAHTRAARIREEFAISRKQNSCRMVKGSNRSPRSG
jgi:predicted PurR-regulated permease PerM